MTFIDEFYDGDRLVGARATTFDCVSIRDRWGLIKLLGIRWSVLVVTSYDGHLYVWTGNAPDPRIHSGERAYKNVRILDESVEFEVRMHIAANRDST